MEQKIQPGKDLIPTYEVITPNEFKASNFTIWYGVHKTPFGKCLIGVTKRGICHLSFIDAGKKSKIENMLKSLWPKAKIVRSDKETKKYIDKIFRSKKSNRPLHLLIKGTNFQIKVWKALLKSPSGKTVSYKNLAEKVGSPNAVRAVGSACGKNTIGFLIPCHRVLTLSGKIGGYRWGTKRKEAMLASESLNGNYGTI